ncbi:MAG: HAD family hydrolase [Paracoccaceae bacterium]|nr:HAD family hydrolase [Paracoccaceae bacterium]
MIRGIIFDKDGTLTDFRKTWGGATRTLVADLSAGEVALAARLAEALGFDPATHDYAPASPALVGPTSAMADALAAHLPHLDRGHLVMRIMAAEAEVDQVPAVDLPPLFDALAGDGYVLGIVTNDSEGAARRHLDFFGVAERVAFVAGADSGHGAKPAPGPLLAFADATGVAPEAVVMVGDTGHDLEAGRAAGMATVGVLTGAATAAHLTPLADAVLPDIGHLPGWLAAL